MFDAEVLLQPLEGTQGILVEPQDLQVGEIGEVDQFGNLAPAQVHFQGVLGLLEVLDGDGVPGVALHLRALGRVLRHQSSKCLFHFY